MKLVKLGLSGALLLCAVPALADQVFLDDVIVVGSECIGLDCANGENFGFDTLRLKENNLRLHFDDTSASASFPGNDWRITINSSDNGGANFFAVDDATALRTPFKILGGAPTNALLIDAAGNVGIGEGTPVVEMHMADGDSPTVRLEQDGSSGFAPQTWDIAGNETNFFVRDVTNGSQLPFKIRPGADDNALVIDNDGDIGLGILTPTSSLQVRRTNGTAQVFIDEGSSISSPRTLLRLENKGNTKIEMFDNSDAADQNAWAFTAKANDFRISKQASGAVEFLVDKLGNATLAGALTQNSDRAAKQHIVELEPVEILEKIANLPVQQWQYIDTPGVNHIGPMAQDFHAAFGLGASPTGISTIDTAGVSLAAIKALIEQNGALKAANEELMERVGALESSQLEMQVVMKDLLSKQDPGYLQVNHQSE